MVRDLHLKIEIVGMPIIREKDGLALSSRNAYLSDEDRARALALSESLHKIEKRYKEGNKNISDLVKLGIEILNKSSINDIDYFEIRNGSSLESEKEAQPGDVVAIAARIGNTRLIDNTKL